MVFDMNFNEYKGSPHDSPQDGRYLPNGGLDPEGQTVTMEEQGVYQDGRTFSDNQTGTVFIRISIPELKIQKCLQFELDETVWRAKQRVLVTFAKDLKDSINYGLYCPPMNGRAGKFLDEERLLREYPLQGPIGFLEFKYKKRVYKMMHVNPRKLKQLHVKGNLRHFIDYVRSGNIEKVTKLTNKGLDPNFHDSSSGETPLTMAVSTVKIKCREMILCLAGGGAHLDFRNKRGIAALHKAVVVGNLEAVKTLLDLGVSPNLRDSHALTPLYFSVANSCNPTCTEMLLQERAFIGSVDDQGWAEIHHACQQGLVQHLEHLLFYGADMDIQNAAGNTPLHICALNNQESCLRVLLFRGANKEVLNYSNQTPYEVALIAGHDIMADILDEHSSDAVVQYRDVPKYSNRRRDSVASMALFAMYRTRSDPRINASFMDGPGGMVSPSSSSHSFSHIHNSYTGSMSGSRGSISGSRGTDSPCSMSISSNSSGPEDAQSVENLHCNGSSSEGMRLCHRAPLYVISAASSHDLRQVRRHRPLSQYEIIRDRLTPKSYHDSLRSRLHGHKVYSSMYDYHNNHYVERRHSGYDLHYTEQWLNGSRHHHECSHGHVRRNSSGYHCYRHTVADNQVSGTEPIQTNNTIGNRTIYIDPSKSNNVSWNHGDKCRRNADSFQKESNKFNDVVYRDAVTFDNFPSQTKAIPDINSKESDTDLKKDSSEIVDKYIYNEETDCVPSSQRPNVGMDNVRHSSPISKPPRAHRPNTVRCPSAQPETNHYANTKYAHSHTQISSSHMTTFQPIRSSASMGPNAADNHTHSAYFIDVEDDSLARTGTDSVLDLEFESVFICSVPYEASSPGHLNLKMGDLVQVVGVTDHGLWEGRVNGNEGWFPSNHVQEVKLRRKAGSLGDIIKGTRDFRDVNRNTLATIQHNYSEYAPRSVVLQKGPEGYGFVLRGAKSQTNAAGELDFRPSAEFPALQYLDSVDPGSRSDRAGLKTGDFILEINGENVVRASHDRVVQLIRQSGDTLALKVVTVKPMDKPQHWLQHHDGTMTLPNRNSKKPAPQPPQRDPQTSLSYSKARGKSITEGMAEIDQIGGPKGSSGSTDHLDMVLAGYDQQPDQISISSEHKTASIRSKHSAKRVSCIELDKIEYPDSNTSVTSSKGKAPAPQPKDYMSPSEIRIKKYHKGKQNGLERSSSTPDLLDGNRKSEPVYATPIPPGDGRRSSSGAINNVYATPGERPKGPPPPPPAGSSTPTPKRPAPAPPKGAEVVQTSKTEVVTINTDKRNSTYSNANDGKVIDRRKSEYESSFRPGISASLTDEPKISTPSLQQAKLSNRTHNRNSSQISVQSSDSTGSKNSEDKPSVSFAEDKVMVNAESFLQRHPNAQLLVTAEVHKKSPERKPSEPEPDYDADSDDNKENSASSNSVTVISVGGASNNNAKKFTVKSDIPTVASEEKMVIPPPPSEPAPEPPKPAEKVSSGATTPSEHSRQSSISDNKEQSNAPPAPPPPPVAPPAPPPPPIQAPDREKTPPPVSENKPKKPLGGLPTTDILAAVEKRKTRLENDGPKISAGPNKEVKPRNSTELRNKLIENTQAAILEAVAKRRAKLEQTTETEVADQIESKLQKTKKLQTSKMYFSSDTIQKMDKKENNTKKEEVKPETKSTAIFSSDLIAKKNPPNPSPKRAPSPKNKPPSPVPSQKNKAHIPAPTKETNSQGIKVSVKEKSPVYVSPVKNVSTTSSKSESKQMKEKTGTSTSEKKGDVKVNGDLNGEDFVAMAEKARQDWIKKRSSSSLLLKNKPDVKVKSGEQSKTQAPASPKKSSNAIPGPPKSNGIIIDSASAKVSDKSYTKKASTSASPSKTTSVPKIDSGEIIPLKSARDTVMIAKSTSILSRIANFEQGAKSEGKSSNPTSPRSKIPVHGVTIDSTTTESQKRGALPPPPGFGDAVHLEIIPPPTGFSVTDGPESPSNSAFNHDDSSSVSTLSTLSDDALDGRPKHGYEDLIAPPPPGFDDNVRSDNIIPSVIPPPPDFGGNDTKSSVLKLNSLGNKPFESKPVESWQCLDVLDWLDSLNMTQYKTSFQQRCVDGKKLVGLTRNDYIQLGVTQVGHRMNLERSIKKVSAKKFSS